MPTGTTRWERGELGEQSTGEAGVSHVSGCEDEQVEADLSSSRPNTPLTDSDDEDSRHGVEQTGTREEGRASAPGQEKGGTSPGRAGAKGREAERRRTSTAKMNEAGMIRCVDRHLSKDTKIVQSGGDRRTYRCGQCRRRFTCSRTREHSAMYRRVQERELKWVTVKPVTLLDGVTGCRGVTLR